jgi:hypothetical protein
MTHTQIKETILVSITEIIDNFESKKESKSS